MFLSKRDGAFPLNAENLGCAAMTNRYQTTGAEGEFEPGSNGQVLRNLVGISSSDDMDELELRLLGELYDEVLLQNLPARALTVADLKYWHRLWLGNVYIWAGQERSVNLGKDGFQFATAGLLPGLLADVMAVQAGHEPLDYSSWEQHKAAYIGAIHAGFLDNYGPMRQLVAQAMTASDGALSGQA